MRSSAASQDTTRLAWLAALAFALFRFWYASRIQLSPDEAYYWEWSRSLALGYYDQGPMLALAIRLGTFLFGSGELGVRSIAILTGFALSGLAIGFCRGALKRPGAALWLVLALNLMLLFSVGAVLMMHDSLMGFFWMLALVAVFRALDEPAWWLAAGLAGGCAILSKYNGLLFFLGLASAFILHPPLRRHLRSSWFWTGMLLGMFAGLAPLLAWNHQHGWPSFQHIFSLAGGDSSRRSLFTLPEFIGSQAGLVTPLLFLLVLQAWWRGRDSRDPQRALLWCLGAVPFLAFGLLSLRTSVGGNWPAQAYLGGLLLVAWDLDPGTRMARWALGLAGALTAAVYIQAAWPFLPLAQSRAKLDSTARLDGWRELAERVEAARQTLGNGSFVAARTYQAAAELGFYLPGKPRVLILQDGRIEHQYRFWNDPQSHAHQDAVLVAGQEQELAEMTPHFSEVRPVEVFAARRNGIVIRNFHIFVGRDFRP